MLLNALLMIMKHLYFTHREQEQSATSKKEEVCVDRKDTLAVDSTQERNKY